MQKIVFETRDGDTFRLPLKLVKYMKTIWDMVEATIDNETPLDPTPIVLKNIRKETFQYILHWVMFTSITDDEDDKTPDDIEMNDQMQDEEQNIELKLIPNDAQRSTNAMAKMDPWIKKFLSAMPMHHLYEVMAAADFLNIDLLERQACAFVANQIQGKNTKELREFLGIRNDFTAQQKRAMKEDEAFWEQ